ncbi:MAG: CARDB domain-containing protein [Candidatus Eisenbacteria bacterium]
MKRFLILSVVVSVLGPLSPVPALAVETGQIAFTDSSWVPIEISYPPGSDSAFLEVWDPDLNFDSFSIDSVWIWVGAEIDSVVVDTELVWLRETDLATGLFHGSVDFDPQASRILTELETSLPAGSDSASAAIREKMIRDRLREFRRERSKSDRAQASWDGLLQVIPGGWLGAVYYDSANATGLLDTIFTTVTYGGYAGPVSGTWTAAGNPHIVVGDAWVIEPDSLIIEEGVEVRFFEDVVLFDYGVIRASGTSSDSVHFGLDPQFQQDPWRTWGGLFVDGGVLSLTHGSFSRAYEGIGGYLDSGSVRVDHSLILECRSHGIDFAGSGYVEISNSVIRENGTGPYDGGGVDLDLYGGGSFLVSGCLITGNSRGVGIGGAGGLVRSSDISSNLGRGLTIEDMSRSSRVESTSVVGNTGYGVTVGYAYEDSVTPVFRGCEFHGNGSDTTGGFYDFSNESDWEVDARENDWGPVTTAEMDSGGNPKNITAIYDQYDDGWRGFVNYARWTGVADPSYTGEIAFTDAAGDPIGVHYPVGSDSAFIEVWDPDLDLDSLALDSVLVIVGAQLESVTVDTEQVWLHETGATSAVFRGSIPFDPQVFKFLDDLRRELPEGEDSASVALRREMIRERVASLREGDERKGLRLDSGDGLLQVIPGNAIGTLYFDESGDWGDNVDVGANAFYGGYAGPVSGTWTAAGNPYVVVGDIRVDWGDTLRMESGVEVRLVEGASVRVYGFLDVAGAPGDSVSFDYHETWGGYDENWGGIYVNNGGLRMSYASVAGGYVGADIYTPWMDTVVVDHSFVRDCAIGGISLSGSGLLAISDCLFEGNGTSGFDKGLSLEPYEDGRFTVVRCEMIGNRGGIGVSGGGGVIDGCLSAGNAQHGLTVQYLADSLRVTASEFTGNAGRGVRVGYVGSDSLAPVFRLCRFADNAAMDFHNASPLDVDARENDWGDTTTARMNLGGNPKNIPAIHDEYDDPDLGFVNYARWIGGPGGGHTGEIAFTDSLWMPIGVHYPAGSESAFVEVRDPDLDLDPFSVDSGWVWVGADLGEGVVDTELVWLRETNLSTGVFRGSIPFQVVAAKFLEDLKDSLPPETDSASARLRRAMVETRIEAIRTKSSDLAFRVSSWDGSLEVIPGNAIGTVYFDALNDWGVPDSIDANTYYGGLAGPVSGVWTVVGNPHVAVGDIWVPDGATLRMEPGVEAFFVDDASLIAYGTLAVAGAEGDSVRFRGHEGWGSGGNDWWGGVYVPYGAASLSYASLVGAVDGISGWADSSALSLDHTLIRGCGSDGLDYWGHGGVTIDRCVFRENGFGWYSGTGINVGSYYSESLRISNTEISGNQEGVGLYGAGGQVEACSITGNARTGLRIQDMSRSIDVTGTAITGNGDAGVYMSNAYVDSATAVFRNCQIHDNGADSSAWYPYDFVNESYKHIDAKENWWGDSTTAEMNALGYPANISVIYDSLDESWLGFVDYADWVGAVPDLEPPVVSIDIGPSEGVDTTEADLYFQWSGLDDHTPPESLLYAFALDSFPPDTAWVPTTIHTFIGVPEGRHVFYLLGRDLAGRIGEASRSFGVDLTPPETEVYAGPGEGTHQDSASASFAWYGWDNVSEGWEITYSFRMDEEPWSVFLDSTAASYGGLAETTHVFAVRARDKAGLLEDPPSSMTFTVDMTPPETWFISGPEDSAVVNDSVFAYGYSGADTLTLVSHLEYAVALDTFPFGEFSGDTSFVLWYPVGGWHTIRVKARDLAGNEDPAPAVRHVYVDYLSPVVALLSGPDEGAHIAEDSVFFEWSATDNYTIADLIEYAYSIDQLDTTAFGTVLSVFLGGLAEGTHRFEIFARDMAGNVGTLQRNFVVDLTPPETWFTSGPADSAAIHEADVAFCWFGGDNSTISGDLEFARSIDEGPYSPFSGATCDTLVGLSQGWHSVSVKSRDLSGREDESPARRDFLVALFDLEAIALDFADTVFTGENVSVRWSARNGGGATIDWPWIDEVCLSPDPAYGGDTLLHQSFHWDALEPDSVYTTEDSVSIPLHLTEGDYWVILAVDAGDVIPEWGAEDDNVIVSPGPVSVRIPPHANLVVENITPPAEASSGQGAYVEWTVRNLGDVTASAPWVDRVYLSDDDAIGGDIALAPDFTYPYDLVPSDAYTHAHPVVFPEDIEGDFWIIVKTDLGDAVDENVDEGDNAAISSVSFPIHLSPFPDLRVDSVLVQSTAQSGSPLAVRWVVSNHGEAPTNASIWYDRAYLSADTTLGYGEVSLGQFSNLSYLNPGEGYAREVEVTLPANIQGTYYVIVVADCQNHVAEHHGEGNNQRTSDPFAVEYVPSPAPDLWVHDVLSPSSGWAGEPIPVSWTVTNIGDAPAAGEWLLDWVMISTDSIAESGDIALALYPEGYYAGDDLDPDSSYSRTKSPRLPNDVSGDYYVFVWTDVRMEYDDKDWGNNFSTPRPITIHAPSPPDLVADAVTVRADSAYPGTAVRVVWTVTNNGAGPSGGSAWQDWIYISPDDSLDDSVDTRIAWRSHSGYLSVDGSYTDSAVVTLPYDQPGSFYIFVCADGAGQVDEGDYEDNNCGRPVLPLVVDYPTPADLHVTAIFCPAGLHSGDTTQVSWTVENSGPAGTVVASWRDEVYLSTDTLFEPTGDLLLASYDRSGTLDSGATYVGDATVVLPNGADGPRYLVAVTDADDYVYEGEWEENNASTESIYVTLTIPPDLRVTSLIVPAEGTSGGSIGIQWTVTNAGPGPTRCASWKDQVYLSSDSVLTVPGDTHLGTFTRTGTLGAGATYYRNQNVTLPSGISGTRYVIVRVDAADEVYEHSNEGNNDRPAATQVVPPPLPDLEPIAFQVVSKNAKRGTAGLTWTVRNSGAGYAGGNWLDRVYLSADGIYDPGADPVVLSKNRIGGLGSGGTYAASGTATFPNGVDGTYHLFLRTDALGAVSETDEGNNRDSTQILIELTPADLVVIDVTGPDSVNTGQPVTVQWTVQNQGIGGTEASAWYDAAYLSRDQILDATDFVLGSKQHSGILPAESTYTTSLQGTIPSGYTGTYYLFVKTDKNNQVYEHGGEGNNFSYDSDGLEVVIPAPADLVVTSVVVPDSAFSGDSMTISWTVSNTGLNNAVGLWSDGVYLCSGATWNPGDPLIGILDFSGTLPPGTSYTRKMLVSRESYTHVLEANMPGAVPGDYKIAVRADLRNGIFESDEENNVAVSSTPISALIFALSPGVPHLASLRESEDDYYLIDLDEGEDLRITAEADTPNGVIEFFARYSDVPSAFNYDIRSDSLFFPGGPLLVPGRGEGQYFLMIRGRSLPDGETNYEVLVERLGFSLESARPEIIGNSGRATLNIFGAQLYPTTNFFLQNVDEDTIFADTTFYVNSTHMRATFNLGGKQIGWYDLTARKDTQEVSLLGAIRVEDGGGPALSLAISGLTAMRRLSPTVYIITYANEGNSDAEFLLMALRTQTPGMHIDYVWDENANQLFPIPDAEIDSTPQNAAFFYVDVVPPHTQGTMYAQITAEGERVHPALVVGAWVLSGIATEYLSDVFWKSFKYSWLPACPDETIGSALMDAVRRGFWEANQEWGGHFVKKPAGALIKKVVKASIAGPFNIFVSMGQNLYSYFGGLLEGGQLYLAGDDCLGLNPRPPDASGDQVIIVVSSRDPNEKLGPTPPDEDPLISAYQTIPYTIYFENMADATAPAQQVVIRDTIDTDLDWRRFRLSEIAFGDTTIMVPPNRSYWYTSMEIDSGYLLEIDAGINGSTGEAHWFFNTIDPETGLPPLDPLAGFLPPNDSTGRGEGHVTFTIRPDPEAPAGTEIRNKATIVFDTNDLIETNEVLNVLRDAFADLTVVSVNVEVGDEGLLEGENVGLLASVQNTGENDAPNPIFHFYHGDPSFGGDLVGVVQIATGLAAGQQKQISVTWTPRRVLGDQVIHIIADPDSLIEEEDEANNSRVLTLPIDPRTYTAHYSDGVNLVSLPLEPADSLFAADLTQILGASMVVRLDSTGNFEPFIPAILEGEGFVVEPPNGYIAEVSGSPSVTFEGMTNLADVTIRGELNFLGLPLDPETTYTARAWCEATGAGRLVRYDPAEARFEAFIPGFHETDGYELHGAEGYLAVADAETTVTFPGVGWLGEGPAPPLAPPAAKTVGGSTAAAAPEALVFGVAGDLFLREGWSGSVRAASTYEVTVTNARTGATARASSNGATGQYATVFVDFSNSQGVWAGDVLEIEILDSKGGRLGDPVSRTVSKEDIAIGYGRADVTIDGPPPAVTKLHPNLPNPFNPVTRIRYQLANPGKVELKIYNISGRLVKTLVDEHQKPGYFEKIWRGDNNGDRDAASGVYFVRLAAPGYSRSQKMVLIR